MNNIMKLVIGILGFILLICIAFFAYTVLSRQENAASEQTPIEVIQEQAEQHERTERARDFTMTDWDGNNITLSEIIANGKPVVVNFWASWCPPCVVEMPDFEKVYLELGDEVQFVMLNLADGMRETVQSGKRFIEQHGFSFPVFFDTTGEASIFYNVRAIPTTVFFDRNGYFSGNPVTGRINERTLRRRIETIR